MSAFTDLYAHVDGAAHTVREIAQQPDVWRRLAAVHTGSVVHADGVASLLAQPDVRIVLTGAGTSAFAGATLAPALAARLHRPVEAVATTDLVATPRAVLADDRPTLLVSFARSGDSPESVAATALADQCLSEVHHLVVTCNAAGHLAMAHTNRPRSAVLLLPPETNDQSFAMTSSFSSMLLAAWLVLAGADDAEARTTCDRLAAAATALLTDHATALATLAFDRPGRIVYLGSGALTGAAREAGLKILELTAGAVVPWSDTPLGFRHGPKAVLDPTTLAVVLVSADPYTRAYDVDLARELAAALPAGRLLVIAAGPVQVDGATVWALPTTPAGDVGTALLGVVAAQVLALASAVKLGCTPDNPFPGGMVNRVVQGVTIHPLAGGGRQKRLATSGHETLLMREQ
jgi:tagatose-6-phosphate ketose/aldose isomerase